MNIPNQKTLNVTLTKAASDQFDGTWVISSTSPDRVGDTFSERALAKLAKTGRLVALWQHDHTQPVGFWSDFKYSGGKLTARLKLAGTRLAQMIRELLDSDVPLGASVGFRVLSGDTNDAGGYEFDEVDLLETSIVSTPANAEAVQIAKAYGLDPDVFNPKATHPSAATPTSKKPQSASRPAIKSASSYPMNIAQKIEAKKNELVRIKDRLTEIKSLIEATDDEPDEELAVEMDTLTDEQNSVIKAIDTFQKIEDGLAKKATPVSPVAPAVIQHREKTHAGDPENKDLITKLATVRFMAHVQKRHPIEIAQEVYKDDDRMAAVLKSAVAPADTTTVGWAAELMRTSYQSFLEELRPVSVYANLRGRGMALNFNGNSSITIPRRNYGTAGAKNTDLAGAFVGELGVIPVKQMSLASSVLNRFKMAVISTFSAEVMEQSVPSIEAIIRRAMIEDTAVALDTAFLDANTAVAGVRPAGLQAGVTPTASAGTTATEIITDLKVLLNAMTSARVGAQPVLILNNTRLLGLSTVVNSVGQFLFRDEIAAGRLLGVPVIASSTVPDATVLIVDAGSFASANDAPQFHVSDQTVLTMANSDGTAPTQAGDADDFTGGDLGTAEQVPPKGGIIVGGDGTGAPAGSAVTNYQAMSMYQQNAIAVRMIMPTSWGMTRPNAVAALSGVAW